MSAKGGSSKGGSKEKTDQAGPEPFDPNPPEELPQDVFIVRWPLSFPEFENIKEPGTKITVTDFVDTATVNTPSGEKVDVMHLVKTSTGGMIPACYLAPKLPHQYCSEPERNVRDAISYSDYRISTGMWWAGRVTPAEAAGMFIAESWNQGEYAVCQPPEWEGDVKDEKDPKEAKEGKRWAQYCLLVRTFTGDVDTMISEWREDEYFNIRHGKELGAERNVGYDLLPNQPPGPPCPTMFFTIYRNIQGAFYIESKHEEPSLESLLDYYYNNPLPVSKSTFKDEKPHLVLRCPTNLCSNSSESPRPVLWGQACPGYKHSPFKLVLGQKEGQTMTQYKPLRWKFSLENPDREEAEKDKKKDMAMRALILVNGSYQSVCIRQLKKNFNQKAFEKDMTRIHHADGSNYANAHKEIIKGDLKATKFRQGSNFISHIVAYGEKNEAWIAYENVQGLPLDRLMMKRRYDDHWMPTRMKLEVAYQVAAGMRFLEENYLCHRHLRASNVIVYSEHSANMAVKITDYMVPYSFLDKEFIDEVSLGDLDWPWWAPECIRFRCFDIFTDMWAYGCFLFELVHMGLQPYSFEDPPVNNAKDVQQYLIGTKKMKTQEGEELDTYIDDIMQLCMRTEYKERPTFDHMYKFLKQLLFDSTTKPEATIEKFVNMKTYNFNHKWTRGKMKDRLGGKDD